MISYMNRKTSKKTKDKIGFCDYKYNTCLLHE